MALELRLYALQITSTGASTASSPFPNRAERHFVSIGIAQAVLQGEGRRARQLRLDIGRGQASIHLCPSVPTSAYEFP